MRSTPVGIAMLNDERPHVWRENNDENMDVCRQWAEIIREQVKNVDGSAPEVVVGSQIITDTRKAQEVGEELRRAGVRSVIMAYNVWNFPFLAWPFLNSLGKDVPLLSLSNNNGEFPGNVGLLATDGALRQVGTRTHRIVGDMDSPEIQEEVVDWVRAAQARTTIQNEVYGFYGGHSMGMETGYFHMTPTLKALGCTCRQVDQLWLREVMEDEVDEDEVQKGFEWLERMCGDGDRIEYDDKTLTPETLKTQLRLYRALRLVNEDKGFDFCGLKGQRELTEHVALGDVAEMLMNDPYDWNGRKEPTVCATEADSNGAITMQLMKYLTGGLPVLFMDVRLYRPERDLWDWCNSGNHASWYARQSFDAEENFKDITLYPALEYFFKAGGASVSFDAAPGEMTFARLGLWDEEPFMCIVRGDSVELSEEDSKAFREETDPTWPHVWARLECDHKEFVNYFPCNHVHGVPGDHVRSLTMLCEMAGIKPIVLGEERPNEPLWEKMD